MPAPQPDPNADVDPTDGRNETLNQRLDRNWNEILQELRVTQTGTQVLTGFLLTIAFQQRFATLTPFQHTVYLVLVMAAVLTTALGLAPVSLHRSLFRQHAMTVVVGTGHLILRIVLCGVGLVLSGTVLLIFDVTVGRTAAWIAAGATLIVLLAIWALPYAVKMISKAPGPQP